MFVAANTPDQDLRTNLISTVYSLRSGQLSSDSYIATTAPSAALGAIVPVKLIASPTTTGTSSKSHIIRGALGGVAALLVIVAISLIVWRRWRQTHGHTSVGSPFEASSLGEVGSSQGLRRTRKNDWPTARLPWRAHRSRGDASFLFLLVCRARSLRGSAARRQTGRALNPWTDGHPIYL
ncbi:hypothetical protein EDB87DRAFT_701653 [Lactarius vividus]|nr:hypothetical protein EDB87DRAFT_701653 [Lactarius vividus]